MHANKSLLLIILINVKHIGFLETTRSFLNIVLDVFNIFKKFLYFSYIEQNNVADLNLKSVFIFC